MAIEIINSIKNLKNRVQSSELDKNSIDRLKYYLYIIEKELNTKAFDLESEKTYNQKEKQQKRKSFNGLTASEWAALSRNVWNDVSSPRKSQHLIHGATYSEKLAERAIRMYTKEGDLVFDPFLGTGTSLIAANNLNRKGLGIELTQKFYKIAKEEILQSNQDLFKNQAQKVIKDDCRNMKKYLEEDSIQLTLTSPPYADFIHKSVEDRKKTHKKSAIVFKNKSKTKPYSKSKKDFGNLQYNDFLKECKFILKEIYKYTKKDGYCIWVVKDYRDTVNKTPYIPFHSDIANIGETAGFKYHDLILWDQNAQRSLILLGYPSVFYTNQNCSFLVIFRKI